MLEYIEMTKENAYDYAKTSAQAWKESYSGIIDSDFLEKINQEDQLLEQAQKLIQNIDDGSYRYLVKENNQIIGIFRIRNTKYVGYTDHIELGALYLLNIGKGKGYGKKIWEFVIEKAKSLGYNKLIVGCLDQNPSNEFYRHMGAKYVQKNPIEIGKQKLQENVYTIDL